MDLPCLAIQEPNKWCPQLGKMTYHQLLKVTDTHRYSSAAYAYFLDRRCEFLLQVIWRNYILFCCLKYRLVWDSVGLSCLGCISHFHSASDRRGQPRQQWACMARCGGVLSVPVGELDAAPAAGDLRSVAVLHDTKSALVKWSEPKAHL